MLYNALNTMKARQLGPGKFSDGQGLWLIKRNKQHGKWMLRLAISGRRREMGLGRWPDVSIAEARERAAEARRQLRDGVDPIEERARRRYQPKRLTVTEAIDGCFAARQAELKGDGIAGRWMSPLSVHIIPKIGNRAIEDVDQHMLNTVLEPIWHTKPEAARKALNRINLTLQHAAALGLEVDMQATLKAKALLGKRRHERKHIPSLPYEDAPAFYKMLTERETMCCLALRFLTLTVARTSEVRFASYEELHDDVWIIPARRTKTAREHRVPLSKEALSVIKTAKESNEQELLFPSRSGRALSDMAMSKFMKDQGYDARPHGFRATFRTWVEEKTETEYEVKETALGHVVDTGVTGAYQRSDRLKKRRKLLNTWNRFLSSGK